VQRYEAWLPERARDPRSVFLVAQDASGPGIVGFLVATVEREIPIYRVSEFGFVHDMWVEPGARGRGLGRALVASAIERFRELGVPQIRLDTAMANEDARRLFATCGFRAAVMEMLTEL
jgi:GNAT superfamily N-acetyltransferase